MNPPAVAYIAAPNLNPNTEVLFMNSFAYVIPNPVPEPTTMLLSRPWIDWVGRDQKEVIKNNLIKSFHTMA